ncbi:MAG: hypothetical protein ACO3YY_11580 [Phycisphaerales bacterium]
MIGLAAAPAAGLPVGDWQFWVVTAIALTGAVLVVRPLLPSRSSTPPPCGGCGGASRRSPSGASVKATLTIGGESTPRPSPRSRDRG